MSARSLTVPASRPEPDEKSSVYVPTPLGPALVVVSFDAREPLPPRLHLTRGHACFNRVDYRWSVECAADEQSPSGFKVRSYEFRREYDHFDNPPTSSAWSGFEAHFPALAEVCADWYEANPLLVHERWLQTLNWSAHYLEQDLNRKADELEEKLAELGKLERQISLAEGSVALVSAPRSRHSALAD